MSKAIGIDLGTTFSCVAVMKDNGVEVIPSPQGARTTPSVVGFTEEGPIFGEDAKDICGKNRINSIYDFKRFIGCSMKDQSLKSIINHCTYEVIPDQDQRPLIVVEINGEKQQYTAGEILALFFNALKTEAEKRLGHEIKDAVITVPAYFNISQRRATKDAATIAGLNVLEILNEPTAAAISYCSRDPTSNRKLLIYNLGGGNFDVTVLEKKNNVLYIYSYSGNTHSGGEDITNLLIDFFSHDFEQTTKKTLPKSSKQYHRLQRDCEKLKKNLSTSQKQTIEIDYEDVQYSKSITREEFNQIVDPLLQKTLDLCAGALKASCFEKAEYKDVDFILVGGSTRMPRIKELIFERFGKHPLEDINPDEAVACGAAIFASQSELTYNSKQMYLSDMVPFSLGFECGDDRLTVVVERHSRLPAGKNHKFFTSHDNETLVKFNVYEGENPIAKENHFLGFFLLCIPPGPQEIEVKFTVGSDSDLEVTAKCSGLKNQITTMKHKQLSPEEIQQMKYDLNLP